MSNVFHELFSTTQSNGDTFLTGALAGVTPATVTSRQLTFAAGNGGLQSINGDGIGNSYVLQGLMDGGVCSGDLVYVLPAGALAGLASNLAFSIDTESTFGITGASCRVDIIQLGITKASSTVDILAVGTATVSQDAMTPAVDANDITEVSFTFSITTANTGGTGFLQVGAPIQNTINCLPGCVRLITPGGFRRIETIVRGDLVATRDYATRTVAYRPVARTSSTAVHDVPIVRLPSSPRGEDVLLTRPHPLEFEGRHVEAGWLERNGHASAERFTGLVYSLHFDEEVAFATEGPRFLHAQSPCLRGCRLRQEEFTDPDKFSAEARTNFILHQNDMPWVLEDGTVMQWTEGGTWTRKYDQGTEL